MGKQAKDGLRTESTMAERSRSGRAGIVLVGVVALGLGALGFWLSGGSPRRPQGDRSPSVAPEARATVEPAAAPNDLAREAARPTEGRDAARRSEQPSDLAFGSGPPGDATRFQGEGKLRGNVQVSGNAASPQEWTLELVPSRFFAGSDHAVGRTRVFRGAEDASTSGDFPFELEGLPFGAYDVRPVAQGFNGSWVHFTIDKKNPSPFVNLALRRAGYLTGQLVDRDGIALQGIDVVLVAQADGTQLQTLTDAGGYYRFDAVPDGPYELSTGPPESPLLPAERLAFRAPSMTLPPTELPRLFDVVVQVIDEDERPIPDAKVTGSSGGGGRVEATADLTGQAVLRHLGEGRVRLRIDHPDHASSRRAFDLGQDTAEGGLSEKVVTVVLRRRS